MFLNLKLIENEGPTQDLNIDPQKSFVPPTISDNSIFILQKWMSMRHIYSKSKLNSIIIFLLNSNSIG